MLHFLKVLFFANTIVLTPLPVDMEQGSRLEFELEKPTTVLTGGARLSIEVTSMMPDHIDGLLSAREWADETFGKYRISATLINTATGEETKIHHYGGNSWAGDMHLILAPNYREGESMDIGKTYDKIIVETDIDLHGVIIRWKTGVISLALITRYSLIKYKLPYLYYVSSIHRGLGIKAK